MGRLELIVGNIAQLAIDPYAQLIELDAGFLDQFAVHVGHESLITVEVQLTASHASTPIRQEGNIAERLIRDHPIRRSRDRAKNREIGRERIG